MRRHLKPILCFAAIVLPMLCASDRACAQSQQQTTDYFYISSGCEITPGATEEYVSFTVSLKGEEKRSYTAYQTDILLPDGIEILTFDGTPLLGADYESGFYPYTTTTTIVGGKPTQQKSYSHSFEHRLDNFLRVICYSTKNENFLATSGNLFYVFLTATPYAKPGAATIEFKGGYLTQNEPQENGSPIVTSYVTPETSSTLVTVKNSCSINIKVSSKNKYSTCVLPFDAELPTGLEAYSCRSTNGEYLVLEKQEKIAAYTPYILYAENGFDGTISGTTEESKYLERVNDGIATDGYLTGAISTTLLTDGNGHYVMQNKGEGAMFYRVGSTSFSMQPGKCWLTLPGTMQQLSGFRIDRTTAIEQVVSHSDNNIYDLYGRRVQQIATPGIYIVNGKKQLIIR